MPIEVEFTPDANYQPIEVEFASQDFPPIEVGETEAAPVAAKRKKPTTGDKEE
jgi:hypothetical protein